MIISGRTLKTMVFGIGLVVTFASLVVAWFYVWIRYFVLA